MLLVGAGARRRESAEDRSRMAEGISPAVARRRLRLVAGRPVMSESLNPPHRLMQTRRTMPAASHPKRE